MNARLTRDFTDCSMALQLVFLAQHQFVDKINVVSCAGAALSAAAGTTVDGPSNVQSQKRYELGTDRLTEFSGGSRNYGWGARVGWGRGVETLTEKASRG